MTPDEDSPREAAAAAILLIDRDGKPVGCSSGFSEVFGPPELLELWDEGGRRVNCLAALQAALPARALSLSVRLANGQRSTFSVRGWPLAVPAAVAGEPAAALLFEDAAASDVPAEVAELVSHELRTPLTVLHAALQLLDRSLPPGDDRHLRRYLDEALTEARQLNVLTGHLLEATSLQSGRLGLHLEDNVSLMDVARDTCWRAQVLARGQRIELTGSDRPVCVRADRSRLEQMAMNLLLNAIMYAPGTPRIDVRVAQEGGEAILEVRDYGAGIKRTRLSRLTEPFYREPRRDRPSRGGLGLGLYLCRELARLHGGRLEIDSRAGQGATFSVRLPVAMSAPERPRVHEDVAPSRARRQGAS